MGQRVAGRAYVKGGWQRAGRSWREDGRAGAMERGREWRAGARKNIFQEGGETIDIGGGLLYYTDGLGCFPGCFCYKNAVRLNDAGLFWL